jgi:CHAT domain-containing protein/tetratricopeptide (TPR) repeat protein
MGTLAGTLRLRIAEIKSRRISLVLACCIAPGLAACQSAEPAQQPFAAQCLPVSHKADGTFAVRSTGTGTLRVGIEERGVSLVATLDDDPATAATSPVERLGTIVLVSSSTPGQTHSVRIRAEDSPDVNGSFCFTAQLIPRSDLARTRAAEELAIAGRSVRADEWQAAFVHYLNAARLFDALGTKHSSALARQSMAEIAYLRLDNKRDSYALASQAVSDSKDPVTVGALAGLQAKALLDMPETDARVVAPEVRRLLSRAAKLDAASGYGARELPRLQIMEGFLEYRLDAPERAAAVFADAAAACRGLRDWDCYAIANQNLALLAAETNNYATALTSYADALRVLPPELDPKLAADIWNNFGRVQGIVGLFSSSERSHATAMSAYARLGDCQGVRRSLSWSGNLLVQIGSLSDAEEYLQRAASRECADLLKSTELAPDSVARASLARRTSEDPARSAPEPCAHPLDPGTLATDNKMIIFNSLLSLNNALMLEGETDLAERCVDSAAAYAVTARTRMRLANARGSLLLEGNDASGARAEFERSLHIADDAKIAAKYEYRGVAQLGITRAELLAGSSSDAIESGLQTLRASVGRGDIDQTVTSLRLIAAGYRAAQHPEEAAHTLQAAANLVEGVPIDELDGEKRATYLATQHTVFAELTDLYASQVADNADRAWLAFATSERGRARSLRFAVTQATRDASSPIEAPPAARYQQLLHDVVNISDSNREASLKSLPDELDKAARRDQSDSESIDREQITRTLRQLDAILIEYVAGPSNMFAFLVTGGTASVIRLGERREIAAAAAALQDRLRDAETPPGEVREAARQLARLVLWPLDGLLTAKRAIVVPDDALHTIPFDVLPWSSNPKDLLVLNHVEVSVVPSALFLTRVRTAASVGSAAPRIELIGDPVFRIPDWRQECADPNADRLLATRASRGFSDWTESLPRLPGSRTEVQVVSRLARQSRPASRIEILLGCAAVPSALRRAAREHIDLLHIATHARVDAQRPRLSALALTPEGPTGSATGGFGLLDILGLKLNSSLVVLSACETSRGRLLPGEGVLGPAQAFLQAGASAVLASYWRVGDEATADFMQRFYKYLLLERMPASAALRKAQLDQAGQSRSFDWAAFAVYGWPDSSI